MTLTLELKFSEEVDPQSVADAVYVSLEDNEEFEGVTVKDENGKTDM